MVSLSILGILHYVKNDVPLIMSHLVPVPPRSSKKWGLCPTNSGFVHALKLLSEISTTSSKIYPPLKPLRKPSTSLSNLLDNTSEYTPSQDTTGSVFVPQHRYNLRNLPSRRLSTDTSTLNFSALSSNSALRLVRQHAQPLSSETHSSELIPSPYFTSGVDTASLLSSNAQTAFLSETFFHEL